MALPSIRNSLTHPFDSEAEDALFIGETLAGRTLAQAALTRAVEAHDRQGEAQASLALSRAFVLESRMQLAYRASTRAYELFVQESNAEGQANALATVSYSASTLGLDEMALLAAETGVTVREQTEDPGSRAAGFNYLGIASFWAGDFETASGILEASVWFADEDTQHTGAGFQPLVNSCISEILHLVERERTSSEPADLARLAKLLSQCAARVRRGDAAVGGRSASIGLLLLDFANCFYACKSGQLDEASTYLRRCQDRAARMPGHSWLQAVGCWARLEVARARGDLAQALIALAAMSKFAQSGEHAQLHGLAEALEGHLRHQLAP